MPVNGRSGGVTGASFHSLQDVRGSEDVDGCQAHKRRSALDTVADACSKLLDPHAPTDRE